MLKSSLRISVFEKMRQREWNLTGKVRKKGAISMKFTPFKIIGSTLPNRQTWVLQHGYHGYPRTILYLFFLIEVKWTLISSTSLRVRDSPVTQFCRRKSTKWVTWERLLFLLIRKRSKLKVLSCGALFLAWENSCDAGDFRIYLATIKREQSKRRSYQSIRSPVIQVPQCQRAAKNY